MSNAQLQSLSQHAKQRLDRKKTAKLERKEKLELYKRFLKIEEHRIYCTTAAEVLRSRFQKEELTL